MVLQEGIDLVRRHHSRDVKSRPRSGYHSSDDAVWELRTNTLQSGPAAALTSEKVAGVPGAILVPGLLRASECRLLVQLLDQVGFAATEMSAGKSTANRHNDACVLVVPPEMGAELSRRLAPHIPRSGAGGNGRCRQDFINTCFRCYRYKASSGAGGDEAHYFGPHHDGKQYPVCIIDGCLMEDRVCSARESQMSVLLYLTGGHSGGETVFHPNGEDGSSVWVAPQVGASLCFWHGGHLLSPLHEGTALKPVPDASKVLPKYVIRTDVFFDVDEH